MSEMVQLDGRCFGPFGYPRKGVGDGIGIGGIPEFVGKYQTLIPLCAAETQNVLGLSGPVVAQQCDGVRVESDPATPCGCLRRIEYNAAPCEPLGGLNDRHDRPVQIDVPPPQSESFRPAQSGVCHEPEHPAPTGGVRRFQYPRDDGRLRSVDFVLRYFRTLHCGADVPRQQSPEHRVLQSFGENCVNMTGSIGTTAGVDYVDEQSIDVAGF